MAKEQTVQRDPLADRYVDRAASVWTGKGGWPEVLESAFLAHVVKRRVEAMGADGAADYFEAVADQLRTKARASD